MRNQGFTVVEMLVAFLLFAMLSGGVLAGIQRATQAQRQSLEKQRMSEESAYAVEYMSRALREAKKDSGGTCHSAGQTFAVSSSPKYIRFLDRLDRCRQFEWESSGGTGRITERISSDANSSNLGSAHTIMSPDFDIRDFDVFVLGGSSSDHKHPFVTVTFLVESLQISAAAPLRVQTTVSTRNITGNFFGPPSGLISYWTFNEGSGFTLVDTVGSQDGTLVNMDASDWVPGIQGTALNFDGSNDSVQIPGLNPPHSGTITFWMKPDNASAAGRQRIIGGHDAYEILLEGGKIQGQLFAGSSDDVVSTTVLSSGLWYHIAVAYDLTTNTLEVFVGGVREASNSNADDDPGGPFTLSFGTRTGSSDYYDGTLDNVRLYDRVLTESEVAQVMNEEQL